MKRISSNVDILFVQNNEGLPILSTIEKLKKEF